MFSVLLLNLLFTQSDIVCDQGYVDIDDNCYYENDINFLNEIIINSNGTINTILDDNLDGFITPLELCVQEWNNGRLLKIDCNPIVTDGIYNWMQLSGEIPTTISELDQIEYFLLPYNDLTGFVPQEICDLDIDFSNTDYFDIRTNNFR